MDPMQPNGRATVDTSALDAVRRQVDRELVAFLDRQRTELAIEHPDATVLVDEVLRLVTAGGKRIRPALCYWGHRAAGGADGRAIVLAAAALELLHTFAVVHDDVMDRSPTRRGVDATHVRFASAASAPDAARYGDALAILVGDLAAVLAGRLLASTGFPAGPLTRARDRYDRMCLEMAAGQFLDLSTDRADEELAARISELKTGSYTVEGPLQIGALLADAPPATLSALAAFGRPLGEAFQVRDDLAGILDGERDVLQGRPTWILARARERLPDGALAAIAREPAQRTAEVLRDAGLLDDAAELVNARVEQALGALDGAGLDAAATSALSAIARLVTVRSPIGRGTSGGRAAS